ncbi:MAG: 4-hydroxy-tetrahydrodipicolinate synthase [Lachnospiraceae bacterium]|nr:4-hydroxy-tetrahydrodipicolinate synthase [Lachnospiraceae bacterium]
MSIFTGAGVAIITPMTVTGEVNYPKLGEILEYQIANGTDAVIICGTTGEASTLSHEEHLEAIRYTVEKVAGRIPVIAGTGSNCTETAVYLSQEAEKFGADALLLVSPYYNKATQKGLIAHFTTVAESVDIPVILYNIQGRTGVNIAPETIAYLAKNVKNIVAVKEASGNISQVAKIAKLTEGLDFDIYSGNDDQIVPLLSLGGKGVISVLSNIAPRETHDIVAKYLEGDVKGSLELQLKALPLIDSLFCEVNPIPVKAAMNLLGWEVGPLRLPLTEMEEEHQARLKADMEAFGIKAKGEQG